jgi:predicted MFS family arabinose efflux permease
MALLAIPGGALVSRIGARSTMLLGDAVRAPLVALVPVLSFTGHLTYPILLALVFLLGAFSAPYFASQRVILPELFGDDEVTVSKASALLGAANNLPNVVGPVLAGLLIGTVGARSVLLVDAASYLFAFGCVLAFVHAGRRVAPTDESRGLLAGVRHLAADRLLGPMSLTVLVIDASTSAVALAVPLLAYGRYHHDVHVVAWVFGTFGVASLAGALLTSKLLDRFAPLRLASVAIVVATVPLWVVAFPVPWPVVCAMVGICGLTVPMVNSPINGLLTTRPPAALRAKVFSAFVALDGLAQPLGLLAAGPVYRAHGDAGVWIMIAGGLSLGTSLFIVTVARYGRGARLGRGDGVGERREERGYSSPDAGGEAHPRHGRRRVHRHDARA